MRVLGNAFDINVGVVVDTHVSRLSQRLGIRREDSGENESANEIRPTETLDDVEPLADLAWSTPLFREKGRLCLVRNQRIVSTKGVK